MEVSVLSLIRAKYSSLSKSQKRVADFVLKEPEQVMISSMLDLATASRVSEPTIMRFLHKLDYDSYQLFRVNIAQEIGSGRGELVYDRDISKSDDCEAIKRKVIAITTQSLQDAQQVIAAESLEKLTSEFLQAHRVLVIGMGSSAAQALDLAHKLQRLGIFAVFANDAHMLNIMGSNLGPEDLLFAFSHSGESQEILSALRLARESGARTAGVTSYPNASMVALCDLLLLSSSFETRYRPDAMASRIIQMVIIDMIYVCLTLKLGDAAEEPINRTRRAVARSKT